MKKPTVAQVSIASVAAFFVATAVHAQDKVFRCPGNEYTNNEADAKVRGCKVVEGASVTIVAAPRPAPAAAPRTSSGNGSAHPSQSTARTDSAEQRARDSDARLILEAELKKTEEKLADLKREYNNGEPEKRGEEFRNNQRYIDRVADLKSAISRAETDVTSLKRELARAGAPAAPTSGGAGAGGAAAPLR